MAETENKYYLGHVDDNLFLKSAVKEFQEKQYNYRQRAEQMLKNMEADYQKELFAVWERLFDFALKNDRCPATFINQNKKEMLLAVDSGCVFLQVKSAHGENCPLCALGIPH